MFARLTNLLHFGLSLRGILLLMVLLASGTTALLIGLAHDLPNPRVALANPFMAGTTRIYDRHGNLLFELLPPGNEAGKWEPIPLERFPLRFRQATLATEDAAFYEHPGIDWRGILRALRRNWQEAELAAGGSTITQQVARLLLLPPEERHERTIRRKVREAILALRLEHQFSKEQILTLYLNHVYYGNLAYGGEAAAQSYYDKHIWELSTAEQALLAGLPQAPALYNPLEDRQAAHSRQQDVLRLMVENGFLSPADADLASHQKLHFAATPFAIEAPHFVMWVVQQLEGARGRGGEGVKLPSQSMSRRRRDQEGLTRQRGDGRLHVITSLDLGLQDLAQGIIERHLRALEGRQTGQIDHHVHNAALVAIEPTTGEILAMIGSPDYFDASIDGAVNVALMPRQPGSALKPITYVTAWDPSRTTDKPLTPATVLSDVPTTFRTNDGKRYAPQNYDLTFHGPISLRQALATSSNVVAVKVLEHVGVKRMIQTAHDLGIRSLTDPERYDLTVTLGGGEVTLLELTNAYATLAAQGNYLPPRPILRIERADGTLLWEAPQPAPKQVLDPRVAALVTDVLADPDARAPAFGEWNALRLPFPAAAKTGTTTDWKDNWTIGYSAPSGEWANGRVGEGASCDGGSGGGGEAASRPVAHSPCRLVADRPLAHSPTLSSEVGRPLAALAVGVWVGNADNTPMRNVSGIDGAGPIWYEFMKKAHRHQPPNPFVLPEGVQQVEICAASGLLPNALCPLRRLDTFLTELIPTEQDNSYQLVRLDAESGLLAGAHCQSQATQRLYRIPPPDAMVWAKQNGWPFPPTEQCHETFESAKESAPESKLLLINPVSGSHYRLDPSLPPQQQRLPITVATSERLTLRESTLLLNNQPLITLKELPIQHFWPLKPGKHTLQAIGITHQGQKVESNVVEFVVQ